MRFSCPLLVLVILSGLTARASAQSGVWPSTPVPQAYQTTPLPTVLRSLSDPSAQQPLGLPMSVVSSPTSLGANPEAVLPAEAYGAGDSNWGEVGCFSCDQGSCCDRTWFASLSALYMGRDQPNLVWTTYQTGNRYNALMSTQDATTDWQPGGEIRFGRRFGCSNWGWDVSYWTLGTMTGYASTSHASGVTSAIGVSDLRFNGNSGSTYFDGAHEQRLWRNNEFHNVELNLFNSCLCGNACSGFSIGGLAGLRYFRFEEDLTFGSLCGGAVWHGNSGADEAYLADNIDNDLFGFQFGFDTRWRSCGCGRWSLYATPKFGIYNNHISNQFQAYRGDGVVAVPSVASGVTGSYPVRSSQDNVAFLTQLDLGVDYAITPCWSLGLGYRVLAITGVGLADHQLPTDSIDIAKIADIDSNGQLILHGGMVTLTYSR